MAPKKPTKRAFVDSDFELIQGRRVVGNKVEYRVVFCSVDGIEDWVGVNKLVNSREALKYEMEYNKGHPNGLLFFIVYC